LVRPFRLVVFVEFFALGSLHAWLFRKAWKKQMGLWECHRQRQVIIVPSVLNFGMQEPPPCYRLNILLHIHFIKGNCLVYYFFNANGKISTFQLRGKESSKSTCATMAMETRVKTRNNTLFSTPTTQHTEISAKDFTSVLEKPV